MRSGNGDQARGNAHFSPAPGDLGTSLERLSRRLDRVYMGLPATAAVADMPVGPPDPVVSALERPPVPHAINRGNGLARPSTTSIVHEPPAFIATYSKEDLLTV